jgi:hypothetical protein
MPEGLGIVEYIIESGGGEGPMCLPGQPVVPSCAADAVAMARAGLGWLAAADAGWWPAGVQADCLRGLERAAAVHAAARSSVLAAFCGRAGMRTTATGRRGRGCGGRPG